MGTRAATFVFSVVTSLLAAQAMAQQASPPAAQPEAIEEVVVRGQRMGEIDDELKTHIQDFIGEVVSTPPGRGYARWNSRVCVGVHNLKNDVAQYIVDRISLLAAEVGVQIGEPGCLPNVVVVFARDAKLVANDMVENHFLVFRPGVGVGDMTLTREDLDEFAASDRAVRWWHVSLPVDARTGRPAIRLPGGDNAIPMVAVAGPSRIHSGIRDDLQLVVMVVDTTKLIGTTWQQLADYLAVVSLAQIDPDANPAAYDSILNLFSNPAAYSGLTNWDRSYVRALYGFDQERVPSMQTRDLVGKMLRDPESQQ